MGYITVEYSVSSKDGGKTRIRSGSIVKIVLSKAENGSIILFHDGDRFSKKANRSQTREALPVSIESLQGKGYAFVTVPELLDLKNVQEARQGIQSWWKRSTGWKR